MSTTNQLPSSSSSSSSNLEISPSVNAKMNIDEACKKNRLIGLHRIELDEAATVTSSIPIPSAGHFLLQGKETPRPKASSLPSSSTKVQAHSFQTLEQLRADILKMRNSDEGNNVLMDHYAARYACAVTDPKTNATSSMNNQKGSPCFKTNGGTCLEEAIIHYNKHALPAVSMDHPSPPPLPMVHGKPHEHPTPSLNSLYP